jgi:hypothetical protein
MCVCVCVCVRAHAPSALQWYVVGRTGRHIIGQSGFNVSPNKDAPAHSKRHLKATFHHTDMVRPQLSD